jgi:hypothetical protein
MKFIIYGIIINKKKLSSIIQCKYQSNTQNRKEIEANIKKSLTEQKAPAETIKNTKIILKKLAV